MITAVLRSIGSVIAGLIAAFLLIIGVEILSAIVHPLPPGVDPHDIEACQVHVARYPAWVLAVAVVLWGLTVFISSWVAARLGTGRHPAHGFVVGLILWAAVLFNMSMLPYPSWFWINAIVFPAACYAGAKRGQGRRATLTTSEAPSAD